MPAYPHLSGPPGPSLPFLPGLLRCSQGPKSRLLFLVWRFPFSVMGECGLHVGTIGFIKSILHDDAPIIPNSFIVIKDLLVGIVTESILFWGKLTVHDFIVIIFTNGPGVNKKLLVGIFNHISVDILAGWIYYGLPST